MEGQAERKSGHIYTLCRMRKPGDLGREEVGVRPDWSRRREEIVKLGLGEREGGGDETEEKRLL